MSVSLTDFITYQKDALKAFEKYWMENHKKTPEDFPLSMKEGNEGLWWEMLQEWFWEDEEKVKEKLTTE